MPMQGWMGPNYSISTACATSNFCILSAANHIMRGETVSNLIFRDILWGTPYLLTCPKHAGFDAVWWFWCSNYTNWYGNSLFEMSSSQLLLAYCFVLLEHLVFAWILWWSFLLLHAGLGGFVACRALSQRNSDPTKASRPWDMVSPPRFV